MLLAALQASPLAQLNAYPIYQQVGLHCQSQHSGGPSYHPILALCYFQALFRLLPICVCLITMYLCPSSCLSGLLLFLKLLILERLHRGTSNMWPSKKTGVKNVKKRLPQDRELGGRGGGGFADELTDDEGLRDGGGSGGGRKEGGGGGGGVREGKGGVGGR